MAWPPCKKCDPDGLKILPVLYAVLPSPVKAKIPAGLSGAQVTTQPLSDDHHYGLRIMREGYLYLIYAKGPKGKNYAEAYRVLANGTVQPLPLPAPKISIPEPACKTAGHGIRSETITIQKPSECGEVFVAFAEHRWSDATLKFYLSPQHLAKRSLRMQSFFPSQWVQGGKYEHALEASEDHIAAVVEYSPDFRPQQLAPNEYTLGTLSKPDGGFDAAKIKLESTRYPVFQRYNQAKDLAAFMRGATAGPPGKPYPPMLLALWDGIGVVHELAGFRNDAGSMLTKYAQERAMQIDAMECIREAKAAKEAQARNDVVRRHSGEVDSYSSMQQTWMPSNPTARAQAQARADASTKAFIERQNDLIKMEQAEAVTFADSSWERSYQPLLVAGQPAAFDNKFKTFQQAVWALQSKRTADIAAWIKAPLFLHTLLDYNEEDRDDGKAFEAVIAEAINGLPSEKSGGELVEQLVNQMDPTLDESLVWRAFAFNQAKSKAELKAFLAKATEHKSTPAETFAENAELVNQYAEQLKSLFEYREKMGEVAEHEQPISATERYLKELHGDRLIITIGDALFKWTGLGKLGDCVGALLVRLAMLARVGVSQADTVSLVQWAAKVEPAMRLKLQAGYASYRAKGIPAGSAYVKTLQDLAADDDGQLYRARWNAIKLSGEVGEQAQFGIRLGGTLAVIELLSFGCNLAKVDKTGEDYAMLVAGGFSSVSACLMASTKLMTSFAEDGAATLANLKALTGFLGGAAAAIGAVVDFGKFVNNLGRNNGVSSLFFIKGALGGLGAAASVLTALTSSAPLIAKIGGGNGTVFLARIGASIQGATAGTGTMATAEGDFAARKAFAKAAAMTAMDAAAERSGIVISERAALLILGRTILFLSGWEVAVVLTAVQILIWVFSDDELQEWIKQCIFGVDSSKKWDFKKQHESFEEALKAVGWA